jgi:hypothetical protein
MRFTILFLCIGFIYGIDLDRDIDKSLFVKNIDSTLYIACKYNSNYDLISIWKRCMANNLYTFLRVSLYSNPADTINENVTRTYTKAILNATSTDIIGPITFNGYLAGGNHTYIDSTGTLYKTARTNFVEIIAGDKIMSDNFELYLDSVKIIVSNEIYNPPDLPLKNVYIEESVQYTVVPNSIGVKLTHTFRKDLYINSYYGMQTSNNSVVQKKILIPNSQYLSEMDMINGLTSGVIDFFPDAFKLIHSNLDKTICGSVNNFV